MSEFTREEKEKIVKGARCCQNNGDCEHCSLWGQKCLEQKNKLLISLYEKYEKEEPAPSDNDTSSKNDNSLSHLNDTSKSKICQAFESAERVTNLILDFYESMSEAEKRAFDLGEAFGEALDAKNILEELKFGEQHDKENN